MLHFLSLKGAYMRGYWRLGVAAVVLAGLTASAVVFGRASSPQATVAKPAHMALHAKAGEDEGGLAAQEYADRAFPASQVTLDEVQGAMNADAKAKKKGPKFNAKRWDFLGPDTLDVDRLGTQSFIKPTQWSGRVTALTM